MRRRCFVRDRLGVMPFWSFPIVVGVGIFFAESRPSFVGLPMGVLFIAVGLPGLLNYGFYSRLCITPTYLRYTDWFGRAIKEVQLTEIAQISTRFESGGTGWTTYFVISWAGGTIDLNRATWRKVDLKELFRALQEGAPSMEISDDAMERLGSMGKWITFGVAGL